jgi:hypothetical protein
VIDHPPRELAWLKRLAESGKRDELVRYLTDKNTAAQDILPELQHASRRDALLSLRGLLAAGVMWHSLTKRWKVDYGVCPEGPRRRKQLAIPFRAADTPAERAEFAFADQTLSLTALSYAFGGLSMNEVIQAFQILEEQNPVARESTYKEWFESTRSSLSAEDAVSLDSFKKIDLTNVSQCRLICATYARNVALIHFWLRQCVLPSETVQYPHRLKSTAFHLREAEGGTTVGFSGTNDMMLQLEATNGLMLDMLLKSGKYQGELLATADPVWKTLLSFAVDKGASALIDAGAMLAGLELSDAANFLLKLLLEKEHPLRAVVFFQRSEDDDNGEDAARC